MSITAVAKHLRIASHKIERHVYILVRLQELDCIEHAMWYSVFFLPLVAIATVHAQSLLNATARYPQLSDFSQLLLSFPDIAANLLTNISTGSEQQTILVPSNDAFNTFRQQNNGNISSLSSSDVANILNYHTLQGALSSSDIQRPGGLISNTALTNSTYANREVPATGGKLSQVSSFRLVTLLLEPKSMPDKSTLLAAWM